MKDSNTYYYKNSGGNVLTVTNPADSSLYEVVFPANWEDIEIGWGRNNTYFGVFRAVASPMDFVNDNTKRQQDGADICRYVFYRESYDGELYFKLEICDPITWNYSQLYFGKLDFTTADDDTLTKFTCEIDEAGLVQLLKANDTNPYNIAINPIDSVKVVNDGTLLQADYVYNSFSGVSNGVIANQYFAFPLLAIQKDGSYSVGDQQGQTVMLMGNGAPAWTNGSAQHNNYAYRVDPNLGSNVSLRFKLAHDIRYTADGSNGSPVSLEMRAVVGDSAGNIVSNTVIYTDPNTPLNAGQNRQLFINITTPYLTLAPNERLYYLFRLVPVTPISGTPKADFVFFGLQKVDVLIEFQIAATPCDGYRYLTAAQKLTAAMTDGQYSFTSSFLASTSSYGDSIPNQVVLTSGDAARNLYTNSTFQSSTPALRLTMQQLFQDAFGRWGLGLGINSSNQLFMEQLSYFFNDSVMIADLGEVASFQKISFTEWLFTRFQVGFPDETFDNLNGKDAYLLGATYKMPLVLSISKEQDFRSPFKADPYVLEYLRRNVAQKSTTDSENDNAVCLLDIGTTTTTITTALPNPSVSGSNYTGYILRRPNTSGNTSGVISPATKYNLSLTPARVLGPQRLGPYLRSFLYKKDTRSITYQTADKNKTANNLQSNLGSGNIVENADKAVTGLGSILLKPWAFKIKAPAPANMAAIMQSGPYGYFQGTYLGVPFKGFVLDVKFKPATMEATEWMLVATPSCDESQFYPH